MKDHSWDKIFKSYNINEHNFEDGPFYITAEMIKRACQEFERTGEKEVRILCKHDTRESRPEIFRTKNLFILPVKNKKYAIIKGEGYVDIPEIEEKHNVYLSKLGFRLETALVGDSEMQHLDFAYASSLLRSFIDDDSLVLTIRGRKYTPKFSFRVGTHQICVESVQTEVDAGYEGKNKVVLIEAKNRNAQNTIIRQLYYPFRQWSSYTDKQILTIFFDKVDDIYSFWQFKFEDEADYNSIILEKTGKYIIGPRE